MKKVCEKCRISYQLSGVKSPDTSLRYLSSYINIPVGTMGSSEEFKENTDWIYVDC